MVHQNVTRIYKDYMLVKNLQSTLIFLQYLLKLGKLIFTFATISKLICVKRQNVFARESDLIVTNIKLN